jgi:hypothetical protein
MSAARNRSNSREISRDDVFKGSKLQKGVDRSAPYRRDEQDNDSDKNPAFR